MSAACLPIPLTDYQRIFRVLKSVLDNEQMHTQLANVFFSVAGAYLVEKYYRKVCHPVAGAAFYKLDDERQTVLSFATKDEHGEFSSSEQAFHCWIVCEGHVMDFMAPLFPESLKAFRPNGNCSRKMFQKPLSAMAESPFLMKSPGDFYMLPDVNLTKQVVQDFYNNHFASDLLNICALWYKKPPKNIERQCAVQGDNGSVVNLTLSGLSLIGSW